MVYGNSILVGKHIKRKDNYFTLVSFNNKELPCNVYTKRYGWIIKIIKKIKKPFYLYQKCIKLHYGKN